MWGNTRQRVGFLIACLSFAAIPLLLWLEKKDVITSENIDILLFIAIGVVVIGLLVLFSPQLKKFWLLLLLVKGKRKSKEEKWWGKYCPSWERVNVGKLEITEVHGKYHMQLEVDVKYTSRDPLYSTRMDCTTIILDVLNKGKDRDKMPYTLQNTSQILRIEPLSEGGGFKGINPKWELPSNKAWTIRYRFIREERGLPQLRKSTNCRIVAIGKAQVGRVPMSKELEVTKNKFLVEIDEEHKEAA